MRSSFRLTLWSLLAVAGAILLAGCASKPTVDYDTTYDFTKLHSFFVSRPANPGDPLLAGRLVHDISASLQNKGFAEVDKRADADFVATWHTAVAVRPNQSTVGVGVGGGSFGGNTGVSVGTSVGFPIGSSTVQYLQIRIDIADRASNRVIWRGAEEVKIASSAKGDARAAATAQTVSAILAGFPPR